MMVRDLSWLQIALSALREVGDRDEDFIEAHKVIQGKMDRIYNELDVRE